MTRPQNAADCAAVWWKNKWLDDRTLALLDRTRFDAVTGIVNAGKRGAQKRWEATRRALDAFGVPR